MKARQEDEHWLDILKDSVDGYEEPVPESLYGKLEAEFAGHVFPARKRPWRKRARLFSAAAAVLAIFVGIGFLVNNDNVSETEFLAVENPEQKIEKTEIPEIKEHPDKTGKQVAVIERKSGADKTVTLLGQVPENKPPVVPGGEPESTGDSTAGKIEQPPESHPEIDKDRAPQSSSSATSASPEDLREQARRWQELLAEDSPTGKRGFRPRFMSGISFSGADFISSSAEGYDMLQYSSMSVYPSDVPMVYTEYTHKMPLNFGLSAGWNFKYGLSVETGLNYSLFVSDLRVVGRNSEEMRRQNLHYLGIPVKLNWTFVSVRGFSAYLGARAEVSKCIYANIGNDRIKVKDFQVALGAFAGAQYTFGKHIGLFLEPGLSTYLNDDLKQVTYDVKYNNASSTIPVESKITTTNYVFTIGVGVRFSY